jgi:hypothetical protein
MIRSMAALTLVIISHCAPRVATAVGPLTQVFSPAGLIGSLRVEDFEDDVFQPGVTFSASTGIERYAASLTSSGGTTSGSFNLVTRVGDPVVPMRADFAGLIRSVGLYFGNDDVDFAGRPFAASLDAYDASGLLGTVSLDANLNDFVDQFLGFNSAVPVTHVVLRYGAGSDINLYCVIDDFQFSIPEPNTAMLAFASAAIGIATRRRNCPTGYRRAVDR